MANLFSGRINTEGQYLDLSQLSGIDFTVGTVYTIQIIYSGWIREGETGLGFNVSSQPFQWTADNNTLYVKGEFSINIAD